MAVSKVIPMPIMHRSLASARGAGGPFDVAVDVAIQAGAVTEDEGRRYLESLEAFDRRGVFCYAALAFSIVAINDDPPLPSV